MYIEADCALLKKGGDFVGLSLIAQPQTEAERFCESFPRHVRNGSAEIKCDRGAVTFIHPRDGSLSFAIGDEDATPVQQMLSGELGKLDLLLDHHAPLSPGFKLVRIGMGEGQVDRIDLTRL